MIKPIIHCIDFLFYPTLKVIIGDEILFILFSLYNNFKTIFTAKSFEKDLKLIWILINYANFSWIIIIIIIKMDVYVYNILYNIIRSHHNRNSLNRTLDCHINYCLLLWNRTVRHNFLTTNHHNTRILLYILTDIFGITSKYPHLFFANPPRAPFIFTYSPIYEKL